MKRLSAEQIKQAIRERHQLGGDADVRVKAMVMDAVADAENDHRFSATISTDTVDADREVLIPDGMDSSRFEKSGTVFWNHSYDTPVARPIGKLKRSERAIRASAEFARRPDDYVGEFFPDYCRALVKQGIVKGVSVGFIPLISRPPSPLDIERYGPSVKLVHSRWQLLEWSLAPLQCNPDAVIDAVGKGILTRSIARDVLGIEVPDDQPEPNTLPGGHPRDPRNGVALLNPELLARFSELMMSVARRGGFNEPGALERIGTLSAELGLKRWEHLIPVAKLLIAEETTNGDPSTLWRRQHECEARAMGGTPGVSHSLELASLRWQIARAVKNRTATPLRPGAGRPGTGIRSGRVYKPTIRVVHRVLAPSKPRVTKANVAKLVKMQIAKARGAVYFNG